MKQMTAASEVLAPARTSVAPFGNDDMIDAVNRELIDVYPNSENDVRV